MSDHVTGRRHVEGRVVKANNEKTRVVSIDQLTSHNLYGRFLKRTLKVVAHDEQNTSQVGDLVRLQECRPMSRTKRWRLITVLEKSSE